MMTQKLMNWVLVLAMLAFPFTAFAQFSEEEGISDDEVAAEEEYIVDEEPPADDEYYYEEEGAESAAAPARRSNNIKGVETYWGDPDIVEIEKGLFINTRFGFNMFLMGDMKDQTEPGMLTGIGIGYDIHPKYFALELDFLSTINQVGDLYTTDSLTGRKTPVNNALISGDALILQIPLVAHVRYPVLRRLELYLDVMGGIAMNLAAADGVVYDTNQETGVKHATGFNDGDTLDYMGGGRLGIEYYTGLRHFSIGFEVGATYLVTASSMYFNANPMLKYTFSF